MSNRKLRGFVKWLKTSVWAFPLVLMVLVVILVAFRVSGTSVGTYFPRLYGASAHDPNLLYGKPRAIRSDEWLVGTQIIVSQSKNGFPRINKDMTSGQDLSLSAEIPIKDWSAIFKPQNWSFFVLPLEYAFAFKWWLLMYLLIVSCYFFTLRILPGNKKFAILFSVAIGLSPFELWWYQSGAFLTVAYGFMMAIIFMRVVNGESIVSFMKSKRLTYSTYALGLGFLMSCFGLILYPPFQISVAVVLLFFSVGYLLHKLVSKQADWGTLGKRIGVIIASMLLASAVGLVFIKTHETPIHALNQSLYPGHRTVPGGDLRLLSIFDSFVMPFEQSDFRGGHFFTNQSEASNFILLLPFLIVPAFALMWIEWRKYRRIDWILASLQICALLLFVRVFTTFGQPFYRLLLLHRVPDKRLIIGFGFLGIIEMLYLAKKIPELKLRHQKLYAWSAIYSAACLGVLIFIAFWIRKHTPVFFISHFSVALLLAVLFSLLILTLLSGKRIWFAVLFLTFTLGSSFRIMPLYRGLGILTHSSLVSQMAAISKPGSNWVTVGDDAGIYEDFGLVAGRGSISGAQVYPQLNFWKNGLGGQYADIYNREGHAFYTDSQQMTAPITSASGDSFRVKFQCSDFIRNNAQYALSVHPLTESCVKLQKTVSYPTTTFYLYRID